MKALALCVATNYAGEVWTWDEHTSIVTLRQGGQTIRVRVRPEELRRLQLHRSVTVRGELAPPEALPRVLVNAGPSDVVPRGTPQQTEVTGTVSAATPDGRLFDHYGPRAGPPLGRVGRRDALRPRRSGARRDVGAAGGIRARVVAGDVTVRGPVGVGGEPAC